MVCFGFDVSLCGADAFIKKKIRLYSENIPEMQVFFCEKPPVSCDVCVLPVGWLAGDSGFNLNDSFPTIAFGSAEFMSTAIVCGCSDYLCDPWSVEEFFIRTRLCFSMFASVRISSDGSYFTVRDGVLICKNGTSGKRVAAGLTPNEYKLFILFSRNRGNFFTRIQICSLLQKEGKALCSSRAVDMMVSRLRIKMDTLCLDAEIVSPWNPVQTRTGRGWGIL